MGKDCKAYKMPDKITLLIRQCRLNNESAQRELRDLFFDYAAKVCVEYTSDRIEQVELIDKGFETAFRYIHHFKGNTRISQDFQEWLRKMMVYAAVNIFRSNFKISVFSELDPLRFSKSVAMEKYRNSLSIGNIRNIISELSLTNKIVFNLVAIQGLNEQQLAQCLQVSLVTAKSMLFEANSKFIEVILLERENSPECSIAFNKEEYV